MDTQAQAHRAAPRRLDQVGQPVRPAQMAHAIRRAFAAALAGALALVLLTCAAPALAAPPLGWSGPQSFDGFGEPRAISCPSQALCVVADSAGYLLVSGDPLASTPSWSAVHADEHPLSSVSCASVRLCVAVDSHGHALISTDPGAGAWSSTPIDGEAVLSGVSCPSESLCAAVDESGRALVTLGPGSRGWSEAQIDPSANRPHAISCTLAPACVAVDGAGEAIGSESPAGGPAAWARRAIDPGQSLSAVSCDPVGPCVAVDGAGQVLASADPGSGAATWSATPVDPGGHPLAISCDAAGVCVAVDEAGRAFASDGPAGALPGWSSPAAIDSTRLTAISCLAGGACLAVDGAGRLLAARVPPPVAVTAPPVEASENAATLSGTVNPYDAALSSCSFEYGTSEAYGQSVPCAGAPAPAGGAQPVSAQLLGLAANTTYHYRLVVSSLGGTRAGGDQAFTTAVNSLVPIVFPHPSIHGTPAVGSHLTCQSGAPSGAAQLTFAWLRDLIPIPGAASSSYTVAGRDSGHHLQCQVTARDAGGTATARSAFVTIPVEGVVAAAGETLVGRARFHKGTVSVPILCSSHASGGCRLTIRLSSGRTTLAAAGLRLARGRHRTVSLRLNGTGRRLLEARHRISAQLTVSGTVIGVIQALISRQRVRL